MEVIHFYIYFFNYYTRKLVLSSLPNYCQDAPAGMESLDVYQAIPANSAGASDGNSVAVSAGELDRQVANGRAPSSVVFNGLFDDFPLLDEHAHGLLESVGLHAAYAAVQLDLRWQDRLAVNFPRRLRVWLAGASGNQNGILSRPYVRRSSRAFAAFDGR